MSDPVRLLLWATPRSCSSVLLKSLDNIPDSQMIFELYTAAYFLGIDRISKLDYPPEEISPEIILDENGLICGQGSGFPRSICSFDWVKRQLEADYPGKNVVIAKEVVPWLNGRFDKLPGGYRHAFLIRSPFKMMPSWKKLNSEFLEQERGVPVSMDDFEMDKLDPVMVPPGLTYKEMYDLWKYVQANLDPNPLLLDSDKLVSNPKQVLSALCREIQIPYSNSLLSWDEGAKCVDSWLLNSTIKTFIRKMNIFDNFNRSTCFIKPEAAGKLPNMETFSQDLQRCIQYSMPFYSAMEDKCLKY